MPTAIITNGRSAVDVIKAANLGDMVMSWDDVLHDGPVPQTNRLEELDDIRGAFLDTLGGWNDGVAPARFAARREQISTLGQYETIELWFEHDLYDQLQLLQILDLLHDRDGLYLVQTDRYLGHSTPAMIAEFAAARQPVNDAQRQLAQHAWASFRQPTPEAWAGLLHEITSALPYLAGSVERLLQDLPAPGTGLARTQLQILQAITAGAAQPHKLFRAVQALEEAHFMGDLSFWRWLDNLNFTTKPVIAGLPPGGLAAHQGQGAVNLYLTSTVQLTAFGQDLLAGHGDFTAQNPVDHWLGGTHVTNENLWRWDSASRQLIAPV